RSQSLPAKAALLHKLDFRRPCSWRLLPLTIAKVKATQAAHGEKSGNPASSAPTTSPNTAGLQASSPEAKASKAMKRPAAKTCDAPVMKKPAAAVREELWKDHLERLFWRLAENDTPLEDALELFYEKQKHLDCHDHRSPAELSLEPASPEPSEPGSVDEVPAAQLSPASDEQSGDGPAQATCEPPEKMKKM
ncbi:unnamed protein product, partial [Effrenium voratum]